MIMIGYMWICSAAAVMLLMHVLWLYAVVRKDNSIIDPWWGVGFVLINCVCWWISGASTARQLLCTVMVCLWAARLSGYLFWRGHGKPEDARYAAWRKQWADTVVWRSYVQVFMLQGIIMLIVALPIVVIHAAGSMQPHLAWLDWLGLSVWMCGLLLETTADYQIYRFLAQATNRGNVMTQGVWAYSRHPNYLGEMLIWIGMGLLVLKLPYWWLGLVGPMLISFLLRYVSGVPLAEAQMRRLNGYVEYSQQTPVFLPFFKVKK